MSSLFNKAGWVVAGVLALLVLAAAARLTFGGPLNPPGPPTVPTGKTQITSLPFTISAPGSYVVNADLTCTTCTSGQNGVTIAASDVTLDLQGFTVRGVSGSNNGITVSGTQSNVEIRNGLVTGWYVGVLFGSAPNSRVYDMRVSGNPVNDGIICTNGDVVRNNIVAGNRYGIVSIGGCEITGNTISGNGAQGIYTNGNANTITDNVVTGNNTSSGNQAILIDTGSNNNEIDSNRIDANGKPNAITVNGSFNTITRNSACGNTAAAFNYPGANNTFGPAEVQATPLGNPWANIVC